jgi:hypothetical protein
MRRGALLEDDVSTSGLVASLARLDQHLGRQVECHDFARDRSQFHRDDPGPQATSRASDVAPAPVASMMRCVDRRSVIAAEAEKPAA